MTEQALSLQSTRSGGNSSVGEVDLWRGYLRQRTHFPSMFGEQCTKLITCTQVLPSLVGARSQHPRIHGTPKCLCKGNYSNCNCCKPNSPVHVFVIVNAINGDWLTMFAAMIILCEVYNSWTTLLFLILLSDILLFNFANVLIMVASYSNINWHTFRDLHANLVPVPML